MGGGIEILKKNYVFRFRTMFRAIYERKIYRIINYGILLKWRDYSFFTL